MRHGEFANANKHILELLLNSWCLVIQSHAKDIALGEIERQLFALDSNGRQWNRWRGGQLPPSKELAEAALAAVTLNWIDEDLSRGIVEAYSERNTVKPTDAAKSGWDLKAVVSAFEKHAEKSLELSNQLNRLVLYVYGPEVEEDDPSIEEWLALHEAKHNLIEQSNIDEGIEVELTRICGELYRYGVKDPCKRVREVLNKFESEGWLILKVEVDRKPD